jgi:hypothetical protein
MWGVKNAGQEGSGDLHDEYDVFLKR